MLTHNHNIMKIIIKGKSKIKLSLANLKIFKIKIPIKNHPQTVILFNMELTIIISIPMLPKIKEPIK